MIIYSSPYADVARREMSITERIFEGLRPTPDRVALIDGPTGRTITAAQVISDIQSVAGGLDRQGAGAGSVVALMIPNCPEYCTLFHGVAWAGGTVTTVNPTYTAAEVRHQLDDSGARFLVTVPAFEEMARAATEGSAVTVMLIGTGADPLEAFRGDPAPQQVAVDLDTHVVVLPYSSGTTGLPKGVRLSHRNLVVNVDQCLAVATIEPGEITPAFLPFFHIYGLEIMMNVYLAAGAGLVTLPRFDLELFLRLTQQHRARRLWVVPPVAIALAKHPMVDQFDLSSVQQVNSGAAPMGAALSDEVAKRLGCIATQAYGMTELSPASHVTPVDEPRPGSVGKTVPSTQCRIVDVDTGEDLGVGQEGELLIKGPQVMLGYLNNARATAETIDADGWLHTGDIAYFDADDYLYISDRLKELIKTSGFQVAPAELEAALVAHPLIADAAVIGIPDERCGEIPIAFLVAATEAPPTLEVLQGYLRAQFASYKQIHQVTYIEAIPKSASGKILRRELRSRE